MTTQTLESLEHDFQNNNAEEFFKSVEIRNMYLNLRIHSSYELCAISLKIKETEILLYRIVGAGLESRERCFLDYLILINTLSVYEDMKT